MSGERKPPLALSQLLYSVLGALLLLGGLGWAAMVEKAQIDYQGQIETHGGAVQDLGASGRPEADVQGYMVRVVGTPQTVEPPQDPTFNQRTDQLLLIRNVEMFQWRETNYGGVSYEQDWQDHPIDSSHFAHPQGHANPGEFPLRSEHFDTGVVRLNDFVLAPALVRAIGGTAPMKPQTSRLPSNLAASFSADGNYLTTSANPRQPRVGDVRVSWEVVPQQEITVLAKVEGNHLVPGPVDGNDPGFMVQIGDTPLHDLIPLKAIPPQAVWAQRMVAMVLVLAGVCLLLWSRREYRDPLLALALTVLVVGAINAVLWLGHDWAHVGWWLLPAAIAAAVAAWRVMALRKDQRDPPWSI